MHKMEVGRDEITICKNKMLFILLFLTLCSLFEDDTLFFYFPGQKATEGATANCTYSKKDACSTQGRQIPQFVNVNIKTTHTFLWSVCFP